MQGFSRADQTFNAESIGQLAAEFGAAVPGFDAEGFHAEVMGGLAGRAFMARVDWIADCLAPRLDARFPAMAEQIEAAMPAPLDPARRDDDFGQFIHAVHGVLAVRHGLEAHRERALDLLHAATQRFTMEYAIRPFLNRWPDEVMARLHDWAQDDNYHVRRLVSEGTRPNLPWGRKIALEPGAALPLLGMLRDDATRYVTRSVANHLNDIAKIRPDLVVGTLRDWHAANGRAEPEMAWMTRHALRTLVKRGDGDALALLGFHADAPVTLERLDLAQSEIRPGDTLAFEIVLRAPEPCPVVVDYVITFPRRNGRSRPKVFKLTQARIEPQTPLALSKRHWLKGDATTFTLVPGMHRLDVQVNGRTLGGVDFALAMD